VGSWSWNDPSGGQTLAAKIPRTVYRNPAGDQGKLTSIKILVLLFVTGDGPRS
jgi:hypothetical protein